MTSKDAQKDSQLIASGIMLKETAERGLSDLYAKEFSKVIY